MDSVTAALNGEYPGVMLREHMDALGIGITRLARLAGLSEATVCNILKGRRAMSRTTAAKLASVFKTTSTFYWLRLQYAHNLYLMQKSETVLDKRYWAAPADYGLEGFEGLEELCEYMFGQNSKASLLKSRRLK